MNSSVSSVPPPFSEHHIQALFLLSKASFPSQAQQTLDCLRSLGFLTALDAVAVSSFQQSLPSVSSPGFFNFLNSPFFPLVQTVDIISCALTGVHWASGRFSSLSLCNGCSFWWCTIAKMLLYTTLASLIVQWFVFKFQSNSVTREKRENTSMCVSACSCVLVCVGVFMCCMYVCSYTFAWSCLSVYMNMG